ncbi:hypothetical protein EYW49_12960 [Siculibacillus lacustris]|uniref:Uncharacterized protein n=1 Tax=Siculibacillus lacustris TaxID=1549641 RepID=A0A4Q9VNC4_9HYPH|nr:hypothetical protein [Siculibacillus lacustris]TBW37053.1 hypothetical protein EYW49_12960 [Siculibacillus lacustris]
MTDFRRTIFCRGADLTQVDRLSRKFDTDQNATVNPSLVCQLVAPTVGMVATTLPSAAMFVPKGRRRAAEASAQSAAGDEAGTDTFKICGSEAEIEPVRPRFNDAPKPGRRSSRCRT